jgi:beta-galactosidase
MKKYFLPLVLLFITHISVAQTASPGREHILIDFDWQFALGHPFDTNKDFNNGTS